MHLIFTSGALTFGLDVDMGVEKERMRMGLHHRMKLRGRERRREAGIISSRWILMHRGLWRW